MTDRLREAATSMLEAINADLDAEVDAARAALKETTNE